MNSAVQSQIFLALTKSTADFDWLQEALRPMGQVLSGGRGDLDELLALIDVTGATLLFVGLERSNLVTQTALIEGVLEAKPLIAVVALGDGLDNQLVLGAMRAGARDFIAYGSRTSEVTGLVRHLGRRAPQSAPEREGGAVTALFSSQPESDAAQLALHLGIVTHSLGKQTLVLDLGQIRAEALLELGLETSFYFGDALRNLRRLDANLIESAFCRAPNGMRLLSLGNADNSLSEASPAELYLLIGTLRQHFQHIVINLSGQGDCEPLRVLLSHAEHVLWYVDQSVPACQRNLLQLSAWRDAGLRVEQFSLVIDRYSREVAPDDKTLGKSFELEVAEVLPASWALRMNAKNQARSMFEVSPHDALCQRISQLGHRLLGVRQDKGGRWRLWPRKSS